MGGGGMNAVVGICTIVGRGARVEGIVRETVEDVEEDA
jgi:hypothetical protein